MKLTSEEIDLIKGIAAFAFLAFIVWVNRK